MSTINIQILADTLNISKSTVSKALRDSHEISKETKKKVKELAAKMNYSPNPYASSLRKKKSRTIAVVMPEIADSFFSLAINGIQSVAEKKGYHVLIYLSHEKYTNEKKILGEVRNGRVDGILISISKETKNEEPIDKILAAGVPVVFFDRELESVHTASVTTNDYECGYVAAKLLLQKGCRRLLFISHSASLPICKKREAGFRMALLDAGCPEKKGQVIYGTDNEKSNYQSIKKSLAAKQRPDAILASVEKIAIQVYVAAQELGLKIPEELKVLAFSNLETAPILNPSLTTVTQPAFEIGKSAATILFKGIEKKHFRLENERVIIPSVLIERKSTSI
ncbi:MAG: LacI family DNA-binding transcriptional regulator [Bacteroidetes bacterium]|nr:LacI family DNA-binding transcriptional regulator [Bacteroidota bacterium]